MTGGDRPSGYRYYVLAVLTITLLFSVADRLVFSILLEDIKAEFSFTDTQLGLLGGIAFSVTYVIFGFPAARLADRSVRKNIVAGAIVFWSVMTALCGAAVGFVSLFLARTGVGVGEAASGPASQSLIADYFRRHELAKAMGVLTLGATFGTAGGLMGGGLLAEAFGWRMAFVLMGVPGIAIGLILYFTIREPERGRYALKGAKLEQAPVRETLASLLANKVYLGFAAGYAVQIMIGYAVAFWMAPVMLRNFDVSIGDVAVYLGCAYLIGGLPGPVLGGIITDWASQKDERWRAWLPGIAGVLCLVPLYFSLNADSFWPFLGLFIVAYALFTSTQGSILSGIQNSVEPSQRGFAVAFALFWNNLIGQAAGLGIIGYISDSLKPAHGDFSLNMAIFAVCLVSGIAGFACFVWTARKMRSTGYLEQIAAEA